MIPKLIDDLTELAGALVLLENFAKENGSIITKNPLVTHVNAEELPDPKQSRFSHLSTSETGEERLPILPELAKILKIPFAALPLWTQSINASSMLKSSMKKSLGSDQTLFECRGGGTRITTVLENDRVAIVSFVLKKPYKSPFYGKCEFFTHSEKVMS